MQNNLTFEQLGLVTVVTLQSSCVNGASSVMCHLNYVRTIVLCVGTFFFTISFLLGNI